MLKVVVCVGVHMLKVAVCTWACTCHGVYVEVQDHPPFSVVPQVLEVRC